MPQEVLQELWREQTKAVKLELHTGREKEKNTTQGFKMASDAAETLHTAAEAHT